MLWVARGGGGHHPSQRSELHRGVGSGGCCFDWIMVQHNAGQKPGPKMTIFHQFTAGKMTGGVDPSGNLFQGHHKCPRTVFSSFQQNSQKQMKNIHFPMQNVVGFKGVPEPPSLLVGGYGSIFSDSVKSSKYLRDK